MEDIGGIALSLIFSFIGVTYILGLFLTFKLYFLESSIKSKITESQREIETTIRTAIRNMKYD